MTHEIPQPEYQPPSELPSTESIEIVGGFVAGKSLETNFEYDNLLASDKVSLVVANVVEDRDVPPAQTSHRTNYWTKATDAQIEHAAEFGFDLSKQSKY